MGVCRVGRARVVTWVDGMLALQDELVRQYHAEGGEDDRY